MKRSLKPALGGLFLTLSQMSDNDIANELQDILAHYKEGESDQQARLGSEILDDVILPRLNMEIEETQDISTGFAQMDKMACQAGTGLSKGHVDVIAALTNVGKSTLAANLATNAALDGHRVLVANFEMSPDAYACRIIGKLTNTPVFRWMGKGVAPFRPEVATVKSARQIVSRIKIGSPDNFETTGALAAELRRNPVDLVCIDYLGCMESGAKESTLETYKIRQIMKDLTKIAVEHNVAIVTLAQLKQSYSREKRAPTEYDIDGSAWIAKKADRVWILTRYAQRIQRLSLVKNRWGEIGNYQNFTVTFENATYEPVGQPLSLAEAW